VNWKQRFHGLHLNNEASRYDEIDPIRLIELQALVLRRESELTYEWDLA
jgi:hypothetical protein